MIREFKTIKEALEWMYDSIDDVCTDNERFAFKDNPKSIQKYNQIASGGCCGFFDEEVTIRGRKALIGCNYGH